MVSQCLVSLLTRPCFASRARSLASAQVYYAAKKERKAKGGKHNNGYDDENHDYIIATHEVRSGLLAGRWACAGRAAL